LQDLPKIAISNPVLSEFSFFDLMACVVGAQALLASCRCLPRLVFKKTVVVTKSVMSKFEVTLVVTEPTKL
jgi:hypothetical protein